MMSALSISDLGFSVVAADSSDHVSFHVTAQVFRIQESGVRRKTAGRRSAAATDTFDLILDSEF
jgi:hypothetical protein